MFSVGNTGHVRSTGLFGQSFTPDVPGPSGSGSCGTASAVSLKSVVLGYPTANTSERSGSCYVYSAPLANAEDIGTEANLVAMTQVTVDGSDLGSNSHTRTFTFNSESLSASSKYYVYFPDLQMVFAADNSPYAGGALYDEDMSPTSQCAQFLVNMQT
jgi:hypothetical protein